MNKEIKAELNSARESIDLIERQPSLVKNVIGLYALSFCGLPQGRVLRSSYLPVRKIDDALDGDAPKIKDPASYVRKLRDGIENNTLGNSTDEQLLSYSLNALEAKAKHGDNPRDDFLSVIDAIIFDHERASERKVLSGEEIEMYYHKAFDPVVNITLLAIDSQFRSKDVPALSFGQGRIYSVRDFEEDWNRGVINIPGDVISTAGVSALFSFEEVNDNQIIRSWLKQSLMMTKQDLLKTQLLLTQSHETRTRFVYGTILASMIRLIENY